MSSSTTIKYPSQYESQVILKDGSAILFRPIKKEDAENWLLFFDRLSDRAKYLRLHGPARRMGSEDALRFCTVDYVDSFAFVAEAIEEGERKIVAVGRYSRTPSETTAEVSFIIDDVYQEKGIGTKLIEWLAIVARKNGIDTFEAFVLPENTIMMSVFKGYGFHMKKKNIGEVDHVSFPLTKTPEVMKKKEERALLATINSLRHILSPRSVAVIGASNRAGSIGQLVFQSMISSGFSGVVYPVTPTSNSVMAVKTYPSVSYIPDAIDLAIVAVPASQVVKVADECGRKKVRGMIVISDGFRERGPEGVALETDLRETAFGYGMRIIGPNCMGLINTDPRVRLNATFALIFPPHGSIAFMSQSGALGLGILKYAQNADIGFSSYISVGNRADIASSDMLQYWEKDPSTNVILLYLESFDNPDAFTRISRRVSGSKPILAIKGGSTTAGSRAALSHTGAMATPDVLSDALFQQAGIIRMNTIEGLFQAAVLLANQPVPKGRRVAILTNGGGPGTLAADACARFGLILPELSSETTEKLRAVIKRDIGLGNPLDLTAGVTTQEFEDTLRILAEDPENDAIMAMYVPPAGLSIESIEKAIEAVSPVIVQNNKPVLACFVGQTEEKGKIMAGEKFVPYYLFPEDAARALANAVKYGEIRTQHRGTIVQYGDINITTGREIINTVLTRDIMRPLWAMPEDISSLFNSYGIRMAETKVAETAEDAAAIATRLGFPVAIKLYSATITHKTDVGGVVLNVQSAGQAKEAFNQIETKMAALGFEGQMQGVTVQPMIESGAEVIIGVTEDPTLGHVIMFGLGGIYAELIHDTAARLLPLT
ncbi:MAG TPA: GNAT family N-acetyltransferase, partial [Syntrophorhabdaceae bacterium]|nr:GNAT family N-acetyltransferase [Syntrophorhabdaceae bacterium]